MSIFRSNTAILFAARTTRLFAYGFVSVVLVLYLAETGLRLFGIGAILTATLVGDIVISLWITMIADRMGRKKMLILCSLLMILGGVVFILTQNPVLLTLAAIIGIISPSGSEIGPFLSIEQAALAQLVPNRKRTAASGITNVARSIGAASSPVLAGLLMANPLLFSTPFFFAGGLKILYDLYLFKMFKNVQETH